MKLYSWNVNGFRAAVKKGFWEWFRSCGGDVICLQETKVSPEQLSASQREIQGSRDIWSSATVKQGYSGVAVYTAVEPLSVRLELPQDRFQGEGRLILLEFLEFYLANVYFPNGKMSQERLDYKMAYYDAFLEFAQELRRNKPVVVCGDFNTAHTEIDLKNPKNNQNTSGFLPMEREWMDKFISYGYWDAFRMFNKEPGHYTWWTYRFNARARNAGWRIDYFFVSEELGDRVRSAWHEDTVHGSDHCPIGLDLDAR